MRTLIPPRRQARVATAIVVNARLDAGHDHEADRASCNRVKLA
jgi:hypothetical protein